MFTAHINVEFYNSVKAIKYICKYINKGSDKQCLKFSLRQSKVIRLTDRMRWIGTRVDITSPAINLPGGYSTLPSIQISTSSTLDCSFTRPTKESTSQWPILKKELQILQKQH
jgi:hypothetical protein